MKHFWCLSLAGLFALLGCRPEMRDDGRLKPLEENNFFSDETSTRPLVPGTVAVGLAKTDAFYYDGLVNGKLVRGFPSPVTREHIERGRDRYNIYCSVCHGPSGDGDGMIVKRGFPQPPSLYDARLVAAPEGHFFYVITHGYGVMYSYAERVPVEDRWAIIAYIRALQLSRNNTLNDLSPQERARLQQQPDQPNGEGSR